MNGSIVRLSRTSNRARIWRVIVPASLALLSSLAFGLDGRTTLVSRRGATQGNGPSTQGVISAMGTTIAFASSASNLVTGDSNGVQDVFTRNMSNGAIRLVSTTQAQGGVRGDGDSRMPAISENGQFVAFESDAANLFPGDVNETTDIFVRDMSGGLKCLSSVGLQLANGPSTHPTISADGRYVAFTSEATNLVANDTNGQSDVFVADRVAGTIERVSLDEAGLEVGGVASQGVISADGLSVAFVGSGPYAANGDSSFRQVFVRKRAPGDTFANGTTVLVSVNTDDENQVVVGNGHSSAPSISANGSMVAFTSLATNLANTTPFGVAQIYVRDVVAMTTRIVSRSTGTDVGNASSILSSISLDGTMVAFTSDATNLDPNGTSGRQVFLANLDDGSVVVASVSTQMQTAAPSADMSPVPAVLSADNRFLVFDSGASNLIESDNNGARDVFVRDWNYASPMGGSLLLQQPSADRWFGFWSTSGGQISGWTPIGKVSPAWKIVTSGDFAGGPGADVVLQNPTTGQIGYWTIEGGMIQTWTTIARIDPNWVPVAAPKLGLGKASLVLQNKNDNRVALLTKNGPTWEWKGLSGWNLAYQVKGAGHFNGDDSEDLVGYDPIGNRGMVGFLAGGDLVGQTVFSPIGPTWTIAGVGDFNNDDKADVMLRSKTSRALGFWAMNGLSISYWQTITTSGTTWIVIGPGRF